jgi:GNAT superfamily N-acetyltransferase
MRFIETLHLSDEAWHSVYGLWNTEFPVKLHKATLTDFKENIGKWDAVRHTLAIDGAKVVGWLADFDRDDERWFALIIASSSNGTGVGTRLIMRAKKRNGILNGWVINGPGYLRQDGSSYRNPLPFYKKMGFQLVPGELLDQDGFEAVKIRWK